MMHQFIELINFFTGIVFTWTVPETVDHRCSDDSANSVCWGLVETIEFLVKDCETKISVEV